MSAPDEHKATIDLLRHRYDQTGNPLYVWQAIHFADPRVSIPDWCAEYLRRAAKNMTDLSWGIDFRKGKREPGEKNFPSQHAIELVAEALTLSKKGQRNAFARLLKDDDTVRAALEVEQHGAFGVQLVQQSWNISNDRARRVASAGSRLARPKPRRQKSTAKPNP